MARKFFYVCAGMLMLALSFHFGFTTATAQAPGNAVVSTSGVPAGGPLAIYATAMTANGDFYGTTTGESWTLLGNVFSGGPTPTQRESWGQVKSRYAPSRGMARPGATNR